MVRSLIRQVLERVGRQVATDDLFEKTGERRFVGQVPEAAFAPAVGARGPVAATAVAPEAVATPAAPTPKAAKPKAAKAAKAAAVPRPTQAIRPKDGCIPVDAAGLLAAMLPAGKPVVVNHWATWCDPCVDELPRLVRAAAGVADIGEFIGVSWDLFDHPGDPKKIAKKVGDFADAAGVGYGSVLFTGTPEELFALCGLDVHLVPQTLVIAPDGTVAWHQKGVIDHDDVFPLIRAVKAAAGITS